MVEAAALHHALLAARPERQSGDALQVGLVPVRALVTGTRRLAGGGHHFLQAGVVVRMSREHAVVHARLATLLPRELQLEHLLVLEQADHVDHGLRRIAEAIQVLRAELVGLELHVAAVAAHQRRAGHVGEPREIAAAREDADHGRPDTGGGRARLLAYRVACGDVAHLVAEHRGQFGLGIEVGHDAAGDVDVARQRERVHLLAVEYRERVLQVRPMAPGRDALAELADIGLQRLVLVAAVLPQDLRVHLAAELDLLRRRHRDDVGLAGDRVRRTAAGGERRCRGGCKQQWTQAHGVAPLQENRGHSPIFQPEK